jgi:hypothetical protein
MWKGINVGLFDELQKVFLIGVVYFGYATIGRDLKEENF